MKKVKNAIYLIYVLLLISFPSCQQKDTKVTEIVEQVGLKYCPDKRTSVYEIETKKEKNKIILKGEILSLEAKKELLSGLKSEGKQIVDKLTLLPHPNLKEKIYGIITVSVAQVRKKPDVYYEIITQELLGNEVTILKKKGYWLYCQLEDNYLGWVMKSSIVAGNQNFIEQWRGQPKLIVTKNFGQVWEKPSEKNSLPVCDVVLSNKIINLGFEKNWYHVQLPDGRQGFIKANLVTDVEVFEKRPKGKAKDLVDLARSFMGIPYFWGGKSPKGFDCSGFTQTIFKMNGFQLQRDANMQVKQGEEVVVEKTLNNLKPCDLLFFGKNLQKITHVGMYLENGNFIHADGMVRINSFNPGDKNYSEYRRKGLQAVRRILNN
jgi:gamma-D-glutamyl-L-lysine dipeptidyl-peptidase